jgi:broad specificity phosphatase PhoE
MKLNRRTVLTGIAAAPVVAGLSTLLAPAQAKTKKKFEVWFIRHGESVINVNPDPAIGDDGVTYPLTLTGIEQVKTLADGFKGVSVSAIYTSTRLRTVQTADAISFRKKLPLQLAPQIVEVNFSGSTSSAEVFGILQAWLIDGQLDAKTATGEAYTDLQARFVPFVSETIANYTEQPGVLVFVAHAAILISMLPLIFKNVSPAFALANFPPNTGIIKGEWVDGNLVCTDWLGKAPE